MKVLIINVIAMGDKNATGVTMKNMLYQMPGVQWLQLCTDANPDKHQNLVDTVYLPPNILPEEKLRKILKKTKKSSQYNGLKTEIVSARPRTGIKDIAHGFFHNWPLILPKDVDERIDQFDPELIYTMGSDFRDMNLSLQIAKKKHIPIVFHCMDDIRSSIYTSSVFALVYNRKFKHKLKRMHQYSVCNLGICEKMADYYEKEYGVPYSYASNCIYQYNDQDYSRGNEPVKIIFSGGLHFHRGEQLLEVANVVEQLNQCGDSCELLVYAPERQVENFAAQFDKYNCASIQAYVPVHEQLKNLSSGDILLHVESSVPTDIQYMQYSFSTKLVEYCAAGRTIVGYGKRTMSSISYIDEKNIGLTAETAEELDTVLRSLIENPETLNLYAKNAKVIAHTEHSHEVVQNRIMSVFKKAVSGKN